MTSTEETVANRIARIEMILNDRINETQHPMLLRCLDENEKGVVALARRVAGNPAVLNPSGLFIASIKKGMLPHPQEERVHRGSLEMAVGYYEAKFRDIMNSGCDWPVEEIREYAIVYALDWCKARGANLTAVEDELRRSLGETPPAPQPSMGSDWARIKNHLRVPRINEMFHELQQMCANPADPTDEEGKFVRETLIYAIDHP